MTPMEAFNRRATVSVMLSRTSTEAMERGGTRTWRWRRAAGSERVLPPVVGKETKSPSPDPPDKVQHPLQIPCRLLLHSY